MWTDPFSDQIVLETPDFVMRFDDLAQIRTMVYLILNQANKLDHKLTKSVRGARKGRKISKTYAKTVIKDWQESLSDHKPSDNS
jgi:hypothetical protein